MSRPMATLSTYRRRFNERYVVVSSGCWEWTAPLIEEGYGQMSYFGITEKAHRVSWILHVSSIPKGMCIIHKCNNRKCVNPDHLYIGTVSDNVQDAIKSGSFSGRGHGIKKLTKLDVLYIRDMLALGTPHWLIAKQYNVSRTAISGISTGKTWSHVVD